MKKLPLSFFQHHDVVAIARQLLGKILVTQWNGERTAGRIVETEAYAGKVDKASHAYKGRTPRTNVMFDSGGRIYVYLCYGIHQMFNIVTNARDVPHAILIRAIEPLEGIDIMLARTAKKINDHSLTRGPGNVGKAFGFHTSQTGFLLNTEEVYIAEDGFIVTEPMTGISPRIGVDYAGEDAKLPYRFFIRSNKYVSGKIK
jgi:DNA-3-methyladenine glycosylase